MIDFKESEHPRDTDRRHKNNTRNVRRYIMIITEENKEQVKWFMRILKDMNIPGETTMFIVAQLKNEEQMDKMVDYIKNNIQATEKEIMDKSDEISES